MKKLQDLDIFDHLRFDPLNIIYAYTSPKDYEMSRVYIIKINDIYTVVEGSHCSCYGFESTQWETIEYTEEEIIALAKHKDEKWKRFIFDYLSLN